MGTPLEQSRERERERERERKSSSIGALIIRIGFWGPLHYFYNRNPQIL